MIGRILRKINQYRTAFIILFLAGMGILYALPSFLMDGIPHFIHEDTWFHLSRLVGLRNVWSSPVSFLNFAQNGPMVNIFYPWLTMYPMYLFYLLTGSYVLAYKAFYLVLTLFTLAAAFSVMRHISGDDTASLIFAVLYTFSAYRFVNLFRRAHLGEAICMTALLFVLCGLYDIAFKDRKRWGPLAAGMAMIAYSHNIALLIASLVTGLFVLISFGKWDQKKERFLSLCKAAGTAVLFSLGSFVSILYYTRTNELYTPGGSGQGLEDSAFSLGEIILRSLQNEPVSYAAGFWVIIAVIGLAVFYIGRISGYHWESDHGMDRFAMLGILLFFAASSLLPWKWLGDHTPLYLIQFVWRLNAHSTIFILAAFSLYLPKILLTKKAKTTAFILMTVLAIGLHFSAVLKLRGEENTRIFEADIISGNAVTFDYGPLQAKQYRNEHGYQMDDVLIEGQPVAAETAISEDGSALTITFGVPSMDEVKAEADVPVFRYAQQMCTVNGIPVSTSMSARGASLVPVRPGERNEVRFAYQHVPLTYCSWAVSAVSLIIFVFSRRRKTVRDLKK